MKFTKIVLSATLVLTILAGCKNKEETVEPAQAEGPPVEEAVEQTYPYYAPFSGIGANEQFTNRPVLATINNHPKARPQSGLSSADVVYEMLAEGDVTRFLALFQSQMPEKVGPIRSARSYFIDIAKGLDAFYIAHGYSPEAKSMLAANVVDHINGMAYDGILFERSSDRVAPHNSYLPGENIATAYEKVGAANVYEKKLAYSFYEGAESVNIGSAASTVDVKYSQSNTFNSKYVYTPSSNTYERTSGDEVTIDLLTDEALTISNVLMFEMQHSIVDNDGRRDINITTGGKAYVAQNGTIREVLWENQEGLLVAVEADGTQVKLVPGLTWVHFIPTSPGIAASVTYE